MTTNVDYILSYGSLLSESSRKWHSNIHDPGVPVTLEGWQRAWCTRYADEGTTYAGAFKEAGSTISGVLIPTHITDALRQRERYYDFVPVAPEVVRVQESQQDFLLTGKTLWVCQTRAIEYAAGEFPLPQSYVDTCIAGCIEIGASFARQFVKETTAWDSCWINDRARSEPMFPRAAKLNNAQRKQIDQLLDECGVLSFRREA